MSQICGGAGGKVGGGEGGQEGSDGKWGPRVLGRKAAESEQQNLYISISSHTCCLPPVEKVRINDGAGAAGMERREGGCACRGTSLPPQTTEGGKQLEQ